MNDNQQRSADDIIKNEPERFKGLYSALKGLKEKGHLLEQYVEKSDETKEEFRCKRCGRFATFELVDGKLSKSGSAIGKPCNGVSRK